MSSRTAHSLGGMRRYLQMSRDQVFIFVEGRDVDAHFYGRVCAPVCREFVRTYEIIVADRITGAGGGKRVLIQLFEHLDATGGLVDNSQQPRKVVLFFLDKDVDDVFGTMRSSAHVVYTRHYSVENHVVSSGDLVEAIAIAGSIDSQLVGRRMPAPTRWRIDTAERWHEWIALCLLARKLHLRRPASYSLSESLLNVPVDSTTDQQRVADCISEMQTASGLTAEQFERKLRAVRRFVTALFARSRHDLVFKGKWYVACALRELEVSAGNHPYNRNGAADRLLAALIATINFDDEWLEHFRVPLRRLLRVP